MDYVISPIREQPRKRPTKRRFYLYWKEKEVFLATGSVSTPRIRSRLLDERAIARFITNTPETLTLERAQDIWKNYEFQRLLGRQWPEITIIEGRETLVREIGEVIPSEITDLDIVYAMLGKGVGDAMATLPNGFEPVTAIKRKGKTIGLCKRLTDSVVEKGVFTFFANDEDVTLAKITLGQNLVREYDIKGAIARFR